MNAQQKNYMTAKAHLQTCEEQEAESEARYIRDHGITNPDGTAPEGSFSDEKYFDREENIEAFLKDAEIEER